MGLVIERLERRALREARNLLERSCPWDRAHLVAEEKLFGDAAFERHAEPLGAWLDGELAGLACSSHRFLRLLAVAPEFRQRGIGSALLAHCEDQMRAHGDKGRALAQPGNYLSPGIDVRNTETIEWLGKRGWVHALDGENLLIELQRNARVSVERLEEREESLQRLGYGIERLAATNLHELQLMVRTHFSEGWAYEIGLAATQRPCAVHIARHLDTQEIAAFAAHDGNNAGLGGFGPTGTLEAHRGKGLATALLLACLLDIKERGMPFCEVAWIGPKEFYDKAVGIHAERHFSILDRDLRGGDPRRGTRDER